MQAGTTCGNALVDYLTAQGKSTHLGQIGQTVGFIDVNTEADAYLKDSRFRIVPEPAEREQHWRAYSKGARSGPNFWTDAYLRAFGRAGGYTLVTFDKAFRQQRDCQTQVLE